MWVMAFGAHKPSFFPVRFPFTDSLAVNAIPPIPEDGTMALPAQLLRLIETDLVAEVIDQLVPLGGVMTVKAPHSTTTVLQLQ